MVDKYNHCWIVLEKMWTDGESCYNDYDEKVDIGEHFRRTSSTCLPKGGCDYQIDKLILHFYLKFTCPTSSGKIYEALRNSSSTYLYQCCSMQEFGCLIPYKFINK